MTMSSHYTKPAGFFPTRLVEKRQTEIATSWVGKNPDGRKHIKTFITAIIITILKFCIFVVYFQINNCG